MKGQVEEFLWVAVVMISAVILTAFFYQQLGTKGIEVREYVEGMNLDEASTASLMTMFSNKLPFVEKYYLETAIDSFLYGKFLKKDLDQAFYGIGVGTVNVSEIVPPLLDEYFGDRWELLLEMPDDKYSYGHGLEEDQVIYTYGFTIPVPEERFGVVVLKIGKPK